MNKTKIGICTIGAVVILAGSCMIGSTYAANRTKADQRVTATAVRAVEPSNDTLKKAISRAVPVSLQNGIFLHSKSVLMQMEKRMKKKS